MTIGRQRGDRGDRGSLAVEMAILAPALVAMLAMIVLVGRMGNSKLDLDAAAQTAARTISMARTPSKALDEAEAAARSMLSVGGPTCRDWAFVATPTATEVTVEISCVVDLSATSLLPVPGNKTLTARATEVLDRFREKGDGFSNSEASLGSNPSVGVSG
jgi:TadE-like protein